jgi:hypothetical protein
MPTTHTHTHTHTHMDGLTHPCFSDTVLHIVLNVSLQLCATCNVPCIHMHTLSDFIASPLMSPSCHLSLIAAHTHHSRLTPHSRDLVLQNAHLRPAAGVQRHNGEREGLQEAHLGLDQQVALLAMEPHLMERRGRNLQQALRNHALQSVALQMDLEDAGQLAQLLRDLAVEVVVLNEMLACTTVVQKVVQLKMISNKRGGTKSRTMKNLVLV